MTFQEAVFLTTLFDIINYQSDYPLELPMNEHLLTYVKNRTAENSPNLNVNSLKERGFVKSEQLAFNHPDSGEQIQGVWYTPTKKAGRRLHQKKRAGHFFGDPGENYLHRMMVEMTRLYFQSLPEVRRARKYVPIEGNNPGVADVIAYKDDGTQIYVAEIEAAKTQNWDSLKKDYVQMANSPAQSYWIVSSSRVTSSLLNALAARGVQVPSPSSKSITMQYARRCASMDRGGGIDHLYHISEILDSLAGKTTVQQVVERKSGHSTRNR
ncbi:hypothetical protein ACFQJC_17110 [Haloferax namakaokahaiae]|uniref:Uncharacterized protein n=1 Tax=Haloferax namakaokahaiae TaxID=1748331 RepID=A0ABD5ZIZ3_9EURY